MLSDTFHLLGLLGRGGAAEVQLARYQVGRFEKLVAIKRLRPGVRAQHEDQQMLFDEAALTAVMDHPNIRRVIDVGYNDGSVFLVMEAVAGFTLSSTLRRARSALRRVSLAEAMAVLLPLSNALAYAHELRGLLNEPLNVVHRDVAPANILVTARGELKIIDFGIAHARGSRRFTQAGDIRGRFRFMSPEQCRGEPLDRRSDIFSFGLVAHEVITGRHAFGDGDGAEMVDRISRSKAPSLRTAWPDAPTRLAAIIDSALAHDKSERFSSMRDMHDALRRYAAAGSVPLGSVPLEGLVRELFSEELEEREAAMARGEVGARYLPSPLLSTEHKSVRPEVAADEALPTLVHARMSSSLATSAPSWWLSELDQSNAPQFK